MLEQGSPEFLVWILRVCPSAAAFRVGSPNTVSGWPGGVRRLHAPLARWSVPPRACYYLPKCGPRVRRCTASAGLKQAVSSIASLGAAVALTPDRDRGREKVKLPSVIACMLTDPAMTTPHRCVMPRRW